MAIEFFGSENPTAAVAYTNRAPIWGQKGEEGKMMSDYIAAKRLYGLGHPALESLYAIMRHFGYDTRLEEKIDREEAVRSQQRTPSF